MWRAGDDWLFATRKGTPLGQCNVQRSALTRAARIAGLLREGSSLRFHDLRFTFAGHLIVDLQLDVVQVSRILGHASVSTNRLRAGGFAMELAGLEPATSWVRSRRTLALSLACLRGFRSGGGSA
jgi:integrase